MLNVLGSVHEQQITIIVRFRAVSNQLQYTAI